MKMRCPAVPEADAMWHWQLADWRRRVAELYRDVRANPDPQAGWRQWCNTRAALFAGHAQSPVPPPDRASFAGPTVFAYDPAWRVPVRLTPAASERMALPAGADGTVHMHAFARTIGLQAHAGGELTFYWIEGYGGGVFLPFADATSGAESYGGGRYLLDSIKGADPGALLEDSTAMLDFNFAYFPSCAYSPAYICPLTPAGNRLAGAVRAGERLPTSGR